MINLSTKQVAHMLRHESICPFRQLKLIQPTTQAEYLIQLNNLRATNPRFRKAWNRALNWCKREFEARERFARDYQQAPKTIRDRFQGTKPNDVNRRKQFYTALSYYHTRTPFGFGKFNPERV